MVVEQILTAFFFACVLILILPSFFATNKKLKHFFKNLSIWTIIVIIVMVVLYSIS